MAKSRSASEPTPVLIAFSVVSAPATKVRTGLGTGRDGGHRRREFGLGGPETDEMVNPPVPECDSSRGAVAQVSGDGVPVNLVALRQFRLLGAGRVSLVATV